MDIMEKLRQGVCGINVVAEPEDIPSDKGLLASGILDSYGFIEFIGFIESEFGIEVEDDEFVTDNFRDLRSIKQYVEKKVTKN